jgi:hypothetical protein
MEKGENTQESWSENCKMPLKRPKSLVAASKYWFRRTHGHGQLRLLRKEPGKRGTTFEELQEPCK